MPSPTDRPTCAHRPDIHCGPGCSFRTEADGHCFGRDEPAPSKQPDDDPILKAAQGLSFASDREATLDVSVHPSTREDRPGDLLPLWIAVVDAHLAGTHARRQVWVAGADPAGAIDRMQAALAKALTHRDVRTAMQLITLTCAHLQAEQDSNPLLGPGDPPPYTREELEQAQREQALLAVASGPEATACWLEGELRTQFPEMLIQRDGAKVVITGPEPEAAAMWAEQRYRDRFAAPAEALRGRLVLRDSEQEPEPDDDDDDLDIAKHPCPPPDYAPGIDMQADSWAQACAIAEELHEAGIDVSRWCHGDLLAWYRRRLDEDREIARQNLELTDDLPDEATEGDVLGTMWDWPTPTLAMRAQRLRDQRWRTAHAKHPEEVIDGLTWTVQNRAREDAFDIVNGQGLHVFGGKAGA